MIDFAIFDDVLLVAMEEVPCLERRVELMSQLDVTLFVEILNAQHLFDSGDAGFGDRHGMRLLVDGIIFVLLQSWHDLREFVVELSRLL